MKKFRKIVVWMLCALMCSVLLPIGADAASTEEPTSGNAFILEGYEKADSSDLYLTTKETPKGNGGSTITLRLLLNKGSEVGTAKEIFIVPAIEGNIDKFPFEIVNSSYNKKEVTHDLSKKGETASASFTFTIRKNITTNYYAVPFYILYEDENGSKWYKEDSVLVYAVAKKDGTETAEDEKINFILGEDQETPYGVYPSVMDFGVNLHNTGTEKAYDVKIDIQLSEDPAKFPFEISMANYDRAIGEVGPGQIVSIPYSLAIRDKVDSGYYPIGYKITYRTEKDGDLVEKPVERVFYVRIKGNKDKEDDTKYEDWQISKARIIVDGYETDPPVITSGDRFKLTIHMTNASKDITATNILFTLKSEKVSENEVFVPVTGSTAVVVDSMAPGEKKDIVVEMTAKAGIEQKSYTLTVEEKFDVDKKKDNADSVNISIPVKQIARLNVGTMEIMPDSIEVGAETNIMFSINNTGKVNLYNVMVGFESDTIRYSEAYVGNIKPGETGNVDTMLTGTSPSTDEGKVKVIISYEDENGEVSKVEKDMLLTVIDVIPPEVDGIIGDIDDLGNNGNSSFFGQYKLIMIPAFGVIVAAFIVAGVFYIKRKKTAKDEEMDDEIS